MAILEYDDEATQRLLAVYVTPDVAAQRDEFIRAFGPLPGERVVDVGAGPGFLTTAIAKAVGKSGSVCGVDISKPLLEVARSQSKDQHGIEFRHGDATQLPYPDEAFDAVVSTQVLEYVPDVDAALAEFHRVLRVGGRVALLDTDWDSIVWHSSDRARMSRILTADRHFKATPGAARLAILPVVFSRAALSMRLALAPVNASATLSAPATLRSVSVLERCLGAGMPAQEPLARCGDGARLHTPHTDSVPARSPSRLPGLVAVLGALVEGVLASPTPRELRPRRRPRGRQR